MSNNSRYFPISIGEKHEKIDKTGRQEPRYGERES